MLAHQRTHTNLPEAYFLTVPHLLEVPEERLVTFLTGVTVQPLWSLQHTKTQSGNEQQTEKLPMEPRVRTRKMYWGAVMWSTKLD